ncbi:uncharacterized protein DUF4249 [Larkinella arboricola]|uniref:Uncharacterized protein DUF4249 n=1 Tax=Larkinella arboricola TaxID=643671 RepID=A0A327X6F4_LARAB|nr:DUF4249 domain-containing protein [Larkinella arboricola]RAK02700.1 uncharacterized protein DUF4249 [Larkinella arboricola]
MKNIHICGFSIVHVILFGLLLLGLTSCEDPIDINLKTGPVQLAVDGWLTDQPGPQTIRLMRTAGYFDAAQPPAALGATVIVADEDSVIHEFIDLKGNGTYVWTPKNGETFGKIGKKYLLGIRYEGQEYYAISQMQPVPTVDSLVFREEKLNPVSSETGFLSEFYATDLPGQADYYWIRTYHNGKRLDGTNNIVVSYNGSFNGSADTDGLLFIQPIRWSINPEDLYQMNDSVRVEVLSITPDAFYFFQQLSTQINNGGLFASPPANVPTNIVNRNASGPKAVGFFGVSALSSRTARVEPGTIRPSDD